MKLAYVASLFIAAAWLDPATAQVTRRISLDSAGMQGNGNSYFSPISFDGRYVAFESGAVNLVGGDTNGVSDIFVRDRQGGTTERMSVATNGAQGDNGSRFPVMSFDGRYVAFVSYATNLVPGDTNSTSDIFVRDRRLGTTARVSIGAGGGQANSTSLQPSISADGRYVAFWSDASNLVPGDSNGHSDVFLRDRQLNTTERISVNTNEAQANGDSGLPCVSSDGRYVSFDSGATNLVATATNGLYPQIFVRDRQLGTTEIVSIDASGTSGNNFSTNSSISTEGRFVAFGSRATNLVANDTNGHLDDLVRDLWLGTTELVSVDSGGVQGDGDSTSSSISADCRYVAFESSATNLVPGDMNGSRDVFLRDRLLGTTERVSDSTSEQPGNGDSLLPSISPDGRFVGFASHASNLVDGDTNGYVDVFVRDRSASGSSNLCDAGLNGVIACPCSNPPAGSGRGCDNSTGSGGASLAAFGIAYLSTDRLVFATRYEPPTATSVLWQGSALAGTGVVLGQGVGCAGGSVLRLFMRRASGGSITVPQAGDPTVSSRSAALGDVISPGQSRWYLVYYRDPIVLGGCPASSTFNATQTVRIDWSL